MNNCGTCEFHTKGNECRRHSPVVIDASYNQSDGYGGFHRIIQTQTEWPYTPITDGCGDWEEKNL